MKRNRLAAAVLLVWIALAPPLIAMATPPGMINQCSNPTFRQAHLQECNRGASPGFGIGGSGGGGGGGLLGLVSDITGGLL